MIFVDSDVFLIDLHYPRDRRVSPNAKFLKGIYRRGDGLTTIFNPLEICGVLSFTLSPRQLRELYAYFPTRYRVAVGPRARPQDLAASTRVSAILRVMEQKASLGDAQIIALLEAMRPTRIWS